MRNSYRETMYTFDTSFTLYYKRLLRNDSWLSEDTQFNLGSSSLIYLAKLKIFLIFKVTTTQHLPSGIASDANSSTPVIGCFKEKTFRVLYYRLDREPSTSTRRSTLLYTVYNICTSYLRGSSTIFYQQKPSHFYVIRQVCLQVLFFFFNDSVYKFGPCPLGVCGSGPPASMTTSFSVEATKAICCLRQLMMINVVLL